MTGRVCKECQQSLSADKFYKNKQGKNGLYPRCKKCHNEKVRQNYNPRKKKNFHLKYLYGITLDEYEEKLKRQDNGCAICGIKVPGGNGKHFYVDHNHLTNQVRDLLCHNCNYVIGYAKEDIGILMAVINYLQIWGDES
jgi:hypothetical protein